jgi:radical SAM superfamily enzyme YgiQ (UPF0313 family)
MINLVNKLIKDYRLRSELVVNFYPEHMLNTMNYFESMTWLVYFQNGRFFSVGEETLLENLFVARYGVNIKQLQDQIKVNKE